MSNILDDLENDKPVFRSKHLIKYNKQNLIISYTFYLISWYCILLFNGDNTLWRDTYSKLVFHGFVVSFFIYIFMAVYIINNQDNSGKMIMLTLGLIFVGAFGGIIVRFSMLIESCLIAIEGSLFHSLLILYVVPPLIASILYLLIFSYVKYVIGSKKKKS